MIGLDPGPAKSAVSFLAKEGAAQAAQVVAWTKTNDDLVTFLRNCAPVRGAVLAIEMIASYGMPVGAEVFETCVWIGRFTEAWIAAGGSVCKVYRKDVKLHLCNSPRANDATVRQAILDRFGGKALAIGNKKAQGPLYGVKGDEWSALAVALTARDTKGTGP